MSSPCHFSMFLYIVQSFLSYDLSTFDKFKVSKYLSQVKLDFIINNVVLTSRCFGKNGSFGFLSVGWCVGKTKCAICGSAVFLY
jgi:hypothetical protein